MVTIAFVIIVLAILYAHQLERNNWSKERKELYDRIQSGTLSDYREQTQPARVYDPVSKSDEELYEMEIEENKR